MAKNTLDNEQRAQLLAWLAADFPATGIKAQFRQRGWPSLTDALLSYYRRSFAAELATLRAARREGALTQGLALKEARVAALVAHAEGLESIMWAPDRRGRYWNEKAWRETLADIAAEVGDRTVRLAGPNGEALIPPIREVIVRLPQSESVGD
jgi:hypothetical protein